jgi:hypothetical protein
MSPRIKYESYDERDVLVDYIYDSDLMTEDEQLALQVMVVRLQAKGMIDDGEPEAAEQLLAAKGDLGNARVNRLLEGGEHAFQARVVDRVIQAESHGELTINRCPACNKIARTKLAQQCLWCGNDWH